MIILPQDNTIPIHLLREKKEQQISVKQYKIKYIYYYIRFLEVAPSSPLICERGLYDIAAILFCFCGTGIVRSTFIPICAFHPRYGGDNPKWERGKRKLRLLIPLSPFRFSPPAHVSLCETAQFCFTKHAPPLS